MIMYAIVPSADAADNYEMLNHSFSRSFDEVRKNNDETKYLFEFDTNLQHSVFDAYQWYNKTEILAELDNAEWQ